MQDMKIKIVNKSKDGVKFKIIGNVSQDVYTMNWEEFNNGFEQVDGFVYRANDEYAESGKERYDWFVKNWATIRISAVKAKENITSAMVLGTLSEEYCQKFNCSPMDFIKEYKAFESVIIKSLGADNG